MNKHPIAEEIEKYFREVYNHTLNLAGISFPKKEGLPVYMAVPQDLKEDDIMKRLTTHFVVKSYQYKTPLASNINRKAEQPRPKGTYVFAHRGCDEPDDIHLKKSYNDATKEKLLFVNTKEYLLITGFHRWKHKKWMDEKGWTRTSSLWSDGRLVSGYWFPSSGELCLNDGLRDGRDVDCGPRELFLG